MKAEGQLVTHCEGCDETASRQSATNGRVRSLHPMGWVQTARSRKHPGKTAWCPRCTSIGAFNRYDNPTPRESKRTAKGDAMIPDGRTRPDDDDAAVVADEGRR